MDRRQRKTREAIFRAFTDLLGKRDFSQITVGEIIDRADVGRATFYAHFETKDFLLKELCRELFCHIFDAMEGEEVHRHIFTCDAPESVFLHLIKHLQQNDNQILELLSGRNDGLFIQYFKHNLRELVASQLFLFSRRDNGILPEDFWINHITATFVETIKWWVDQGMRETPEQIAEYFFLTV